ncbi:electron transfer flavoprotein subunit beta/FixA family protein [Salinispira pacifica]
MKIICLAKLVPDVENFRYDYDRNVLVRDNAHQVINPEDATALALALDIKRARPETIIETVSMGPRGSVPHLSDLVRRGVDRATLICDSRYVGSDTCVTSRILGRFIESQSFDWILSGTHSLDGGTAHVPPQLAELLGLPQMSDIIDIDRDGLAEGSTVVEVDTDDHLLRFVVDAPAVLSLQYSTRLKLPYIPYANMELDVHEQISIIDNDRLGFDESEVGIAGSPTRVARAEVRELRRKDTQFVRCDDAGIEVVYTFLRNRGVLR